MSEAILRRPLVSDEPGPARPALAGAAEAREAAHPTVWLARLALSDFRCYADAALEVDGRPVVLAGPNGAGKTNLLEAISLLAPGRGLRRARLAEVARHTIPQNATWAVAATLMTPDGAREVGTGRAPAGDETNGRGTERRVVKIDGDYARSQQSLGEIVAMAWLTPQMDSLLRDGPAGRRRFLDRLVYGFDPAHAGRVAAYEQAMRERARLLKSGRHDEAWLGALEDTMAGRGVAIAAARRALVDRLAAACAEQIGAFPAAGLTLDGEVESWLADGPALDAEDRLRHRLAETRPMDGETGGASVGPHRADLAVRHLGHGKPAELCSTGEQKALLVSIVLAHGRLLALDRGAPPLLLLDEVAAHLDKARRSALFDEILALGAQAWLTGTDAATFAPLGAAAQFFRVEDARLSAAPPPRAP